MSEPNEKREVQKHQTAEPSTLPHLARNWFLGLVAGLLLCASLPPWGWWPLAFVGAAIWCHLLEAPARQRFITSWFVGFGWFLPSTLWIWRLTPPGYIVGGLLGWAGLVGLVGLIVPRGTYKYLTLPAGVMLFEWFHSLAPFGGVPISMLSFSQARGPLLPVARLGGGIVVSGLIVAIGAALHMAVVERRVREPLAMLAVTTLAIGGGMTASSLVHQVETKDGTPETVRVAAIQGGGPQGNTFDYTEIPKVFQRHLDATREVNKPVDLVVWPENTVYMVDGTFAQSFWHDQVAAEARRLDAPIMVGVVEDDPDDDTRFLNYMVLVQPDGSLTGRFDKERRVPFGEYVPLRSFFEIFAGDTLPGRDAIVGEGSAGVDTGPVKAAVAISWEIFFPRRVREGVRDGGQIVLNPTNGASYWLTQVQTQQIATTTYRAVESGRWTIQVAPTGFSAIIGPDGTVHDRTGVSEKKVLMADLPLMTGSLPSQLFGETPALVLAALAFAFVAGVRRRARSGDHLTGNSAQNEA